MAAAGFHLVSKIENGVQFSVSKKNFSVNSQKGTFSAEKLLIYLKFRRLFTEEVIRSINSSVLTQTLNVISEYRLPIMCTAVRV